MPNRRNTYKLKDHTFTSYELGFYHGSMGYYYSPEKVEPEDKNRYTEGFDFGDEVLNASDRRA